MTVFTTKEETEIEDIQRLRFECIDAMKEDLETMSTRDMENYRMLLNDIGDQNIKKARLRISDKDAQTASVAAANTAAILKSIKPVSYINHSPKKKVLPELPSDPKKKFSKEHMRIGGKKLSYDELMSEAFGED